MFGRTVSESAAGRRKGLFVLPALFLAVGAIVGCSSGTKTITVTISPKTASVKLQACQQFAYSITPSSDTGGVKWYVNDTNGGNATIGTIDTTGKYCAPNSSSTSFTGTVKAISNTDTSKFDTATVTVTTGATVTVYPTITVTIATGETYQFSDTVTNLPNANSPTAVDWYVDSTLGGSNAIGTIDSTGLYTAPPSAGSHVIKAQLQSDSNSYGSADVTVVAAGAATLSDVYPCDATFNQTYGCFYPQNALFEDIFLYGSNFRSSSVARANGSALMTSFVSTNVLRARLMASDLTKADTSSGTGTLYVDVVQNDASGISSSSSAISIPVQRVPPTLISSSPDNVTLPGGTLSVQFNGGYFGDDSSAAFNGIAQSSTTQNARQLLVTIDSSNFSNAGLYPITARNSGQSQIASANLAVRPNITQTTSPTPLTTQPTKGTTPSAVAVNLANGLAVVTNAGSNSITLFDLTASIPTAIGPYSVGKTPNGVAVDDLANLAFVVNTNDNSIQFIDLAPAPAQPPTILGTVAYSASNDTSVNAPHAVQPYSVAVNSLTQKGLIVYQGSSYIDVFDYSAAFNSSTRTLDTTKIVFRRGQIPTSGTYPHVDIEPRFNWAIVTPGGNATASIVNLGSDGQEIAATIAAPSSDGVKRSSGTVTVTTTSGHNLVSDQYVTIAGVDDSAFDGYFQITVTSSTQFTYTQSGSDTTSGNGTVSAAAPLATINVNKDVRGVSINTETDVALMCDPTSVSLTLFSLLDQTTSTIAGTNSMPATGSACAVNPLTDTAAVVNGTANSFSVVDLGNKKVLSYFTIGRNPSAVAIDPVQNLAIAVNSTDATVTIIPLGAVRSSIARSQPQVTLLSAYQSMTSTSDETLTVVGGGFVSGAVVRINEKSLVTNFVSGRELAANLPASQLSSPAHYVVDVQNPDGNVSNVSDFYVMKSISVGSSPRAVAIDRQRNLAVITNTGAAVNNSLGTVSVVDLKSYSERYRITVGKSPQGVAVSSLAGRAAVSNNGDDTVSIIGLDTGTLASTVSVAPSSGTSSPLGIAIHPATGQVVVADSTASQLSFFNISSPATPTTLTVDVGPNTPAIDPTRNIVAVAESGSDKVVVVDLGSKQVMSRITGTAFPTGALYDPDSDQFIVPSSTTNNVYAFRVDPASNTYGPPTGYSVGFNPTSLDYNYRTRTLVTCNVLSQTLSIMDFLSGKVKAVIPIAMSQQYSIAIIPESNQAIVVDQNNDRIVIVPLPK